MEEINIKEFFSYLKNYIFVFLIVLALSVGGIIIYDVMFKKPVYQAQTTVVIARSDNADSLTGETAVTLNDINMSQKLASTYSEIAKSELVMGQVVDSLGLSMSAKELGKNVTIKSVDDTAILSIAVRDENAKQSAMIANELARIFAEEVKKIYRIDNVTQLSVAAKPETPANNTLTRDIALAVMFAVVAVGGFAFLRFYLDDSVKANDDAERLTGIPVAGRITRADIKSRRGARAELIASDSPKAIVSENIKSLRTNLQFTAVDKALKTILVTSTNAGEGKSFVAANLAISFAQADKRVLLIDCDLRKGRVHKLFGITNAKGLSNLLAGDLKNWSKFISPTKIKNLDLITCGTYPPNPSELLASRKNKRLISIVSDFYDVVIFDGAPVGGLADSVILSSLMDGTLVVVKEGNTSRNDLIVAKNSLDNVGARVLGMVINMTSNKGSRYYNNYYYYDSTK